MEHDGMDNWSSLGTEGGHVEVVEYRREWAKVFERESAIILGACHPCVTEVQHIGSTSVPGLVAKPILDILPIVVSRGDGERAVEPMSTIGYRYRGQNEIPGRFYFDKIVDGRTVVHAHMYPTGHRDPGKLLAFRDYLRAHPDAAEDYARLKWELAVKYTNDRRMYTDSKAEFVEGVLDAMLDSHPQRN